MQVSNAEVAAEFDRSKDFLPPKPPTVTFKQIVIAVQPTAAAKEAARVRAESLLVRLKAGADFEQTARHESMDPLTKETGGDLGWARRGDNVPEFDRWLFGGPFLAPLSPGQLSPVFETSRGFHIVRVDRAQTGEVKSHQILIVPAIDSNDIARTARLADSVADRLRNGVPFDTLAKKFHDYAGKEETSMLTPWVRDSLPALVSEGLRHREGRRRRRVPDPRFVAAPRRSQVRGRATAHGRRRRPANARRAASPPCEADLANRGGVRRYVDTLKKQTYVSDSLRRAGRASRDVTTAKNP